MQITTCLLALAATHSAPTSLQDDALLALVPPDAVFVAHVPDARALHSLKETNAWIGFLADPAWRKFFADTVLELTGSADQQAVLDSIWNHLLSDGGEMLFYVDLRADNEAGAGFAMRGGERARAAIRNALGVPAGDHAEGTTVSFAGESHVYREREDLVMVITSPDPESVATDARAAVARFEAGEPAGVLVRPDVRTLRSGAALEFAINLGPLWRILHAQESATDDFMNEVYRSLSAIEWVYGKAVFGEGEALDIEVSAPYEAESYLGQLYGFFGEADKALLRRIPAGMLNASVFSFDVNGFADWGLALLQEHSAEDHATFEQGLEDAIANYGIDARGLVENLTGQFLSFSPPPSIDSVLSLEAQAMQLEEGAFVAMIQDADAIIDLVDGVLEVSGVVNFFNSSTRGDFDVWSTDASLGVDASLAVGDDAFVFDVGSTSIEAFAALASGQGKSILDDEKMAKATVGCSGFMVAVQDTRATFGVFNSALGPLLDTMTSELPEQRPDLDILGRGMELFGALGEQYFDGATTTTVNVHGGLLQLVMRAR